MSSFKFLKPEEFQLSPEQARAIAEFKRAALQMGETLSARMARAAAEMKAAIDLAAERRKSR